MIAYVNILKIIGSYCLLMHVRYRSSKYLCISQDDEALDRNLHLRVSHKLGLHFDTNGPQHKAAGITLMAVSSHRFVGTTHSHIPCHL